MGHGQQIDLKIKKMRIKYEEGILESLYIESCYCLSFSTRALVPVSHIFIVGPKGMRNSEAVHDLAVELGGLVHESTICLFFSLAITDPSFISQL
jgi:hypothetical protein